MNRNMVVSGVIAAALHGAVLAIPGGPAPVRPEDPPLIEFVPIPMPPPEQEQIIVATDVPEKGAPRENFTPTSPETPVIGPVDFPQPKVPGPEVGPTTLNDLGRERFAVSEAGFGEGPNIIGSLNLDNPPHTRVRIPPPYPVEARARGITGEVLVEFVVDEVGRVTNPRVVRSTDRVFEEPSLRAVSKWRFEPGRLHGQIVRFRMSLPLVFNLND